MSRAAYRVLWSENAALDLEEAVRYLARESPAGARRWLTRVRKWAATLRALPQRGRMVPELLEFGITTWRELVADPYRLVYRIDRRTVFVDGLFDSRQDLEELLITRLLTHET
ncbi:MAG: type II toxin-antitoxin system RelE/ParE family toxin [Gemmatimonadetes bacterium]|nr:type II toxin-antitoxin system RelE/ParE family toxin [Gemmatimonadota bacterium]